MLCFASVFIRAEELDVLVTGLSELDFGELARSTKYDGGFSGEHPTVRAFWKAVEEMSMDEQKRLLMFATGSKKVRTRCVCVPVCIVVLQCRKKEVHNSFKRYILV